MIPIKRGDNFEWGAQVLGPTGAVQDFTSWTLAAQVRNGSDCLIEQLTAEWVDATQGLYRVASADTSGWPVGRLTFDVQLTDPSGRRFSTNTQAINVIRDVTHA